MSSHPNPAQMIVGLSSDLTTMKEKEFVTKWLLSLREYVSGNDVAIALWLQENDITAFSEVTIVDATGETLFVVPSILMKQDKVLPNNVASEIGEIMYRADNLNRTIPGRGDEFIRREITDKVVTTDKLKEYQNRWDSIFVRYDLEPVFSNTHTTGSFTEDDGDFDGYEEL